MLVFVLASTEAFGLQAGTEKVQGGCGESKDPWPECAKPTKKFEHIMNTQPVYRWDDVESAFDYTRPASVHRFTASGPSLNYTDTTTIISNGTTYYRCVDDS